MISSNSVTNGSTTGFARRDRGMTPSAPIANDHEIEVGKERGARSSPYCSNVATGRNVDRQLGEIVLGIGCIPESRQTNGWLSADLQIDVTETQGDLLTQGIPADNVP